MQPVVGHFAYGLHLSHFASRAAPQNGHGIKSGHCSSLGICDSYAVGGFDDAGLAYGRYFGNCSVMGLPFLGQYGRDSLGQTLVAQSTPHGQGLALSVAGNLRTVGMAGPHGTGQRSGRWVFWWAS